MLRAIERRGPGRPDPNIIALLSLKLLLLGFFILLNALSQYEEDRARRVLESVNEAFNGRVQALESLSPHSAALGSLGETVGLLEAVGALFESMVPAVRTEISAEGTRLRLELSAGSIFRPGREALQPGRKLLLRRFAQAVVDGRAGVDYEVEVYHGVSASAVGALADAGARALEVRRSSIVVRELIALGVPPERLSAGIIPGHPGRLQLVVQIHETSRRAFDYRELVR